MANLSKEERKRRIEEVKIAKRAEVLATMPLTPAQLNGLLDYLDANLKSCDHTTKLYENFLQLEQLSVRSILPWFRDRGGGCDCEILANFVGLAESLGERPTSPQASTKVTKEPRDLTSMTGWDLSALPKPWRIGNLYDSAEPLRLQFGKKSNFSVSIIETPLPFATTGDDSSWIKLWYSLTKLPEKSPIEVAHEPLSLPDGMHSTMAFTSNWTPVYCWVYPDDQSWHVQARTELARQRSDIPQISQLIQYLETNRS